jgi:hypothetical protein
MVYSQVTTLQRALMAISRTSDIRHQRPGTGFDTPEFRCEQHGRDIISVAIESKNGPTVALLSARELGDRGPPEAGGSSRL